MQTMPDATVMRSGRSVSMGALLALGSGLALYQLTSLVLGPAGSRSLPLSLSLPVTEVEDLSDPVTSNVNLILGSLMPAAPLAAASAGNPDVASINRRGSVRVSTPGNALAPAPIVAPAHPSATPTPLPTGLKPVPPVE